MNHWRGIWATLDYYTGTQWTTAIMSLLVGITGLVWLRAFRNIMAPPLIIVSDGPEEYFTFPTMFRSAVMLAVVPFSSFTFDENASN